MEPVQIATSNSDNVRTLFTLTNNGNENVIGKLVKDWYEDAQGLRPSGWYWIMFDGTYGKTFPRMRDALADFERERATERE